MNRNDRIRTIVDRLGLNIQTTGLVEFSSVYHAEPLSGDALVPATKQAVDTADRLIKPVRGLSWLSIADYLSGNPPWLKGEFNRSELVAGFAQFEIKSTVVSYTDGLEIYQLNQEPVFHPFTVR